MKLLIFNKKAPVPEIPALAIWDDTTVADKLRQEFSNGIVLIVRTTDKSLFEEVYKKIKIKNCHIKNEKVELYRALKYDSTKEQDIPRRLITGFSTVSAFKRSFNKFYRTHFTQNHPPCLIFVPDEIVDNYPNIALKPKRIINTSKDPMIRMINEAMMNPMIQNIKEVFIGESFNIKQTQALICKAAQCNSSVLIMGESGTGKEIIARRIYENSTHYKRKDGLYAVNCSALPEQLLESELFGHVKGAFTGALSEKTGLFEAADKGTLFLDEIGDLSLPNQAKLLRVLEAKEIRPLGSTKTIKVDVRIIAATNRILQSMMHQKTFREDLFHRLNEISIYAPPLREHPDDIPTIASHLWANLGREDKLSNDFLNYLKKYPWPGNVRELKSLLSTISALFPKISPGCAHIDSIRKHQYKILNESQSLGDNSSDMVLRAQSRSRIIEVQNLLRGIKIEMRPYISKISPKTKSAPPGKLKALVEIEVLKLEQYCREPIYFRSHNLFENIKRFRYILEKNLNKWPEKSENLRKLWQGELEDLYNRIDKEVFQLIWGGNDQ